jgi:hypothetical protein
MFENTETGQKLRAEYNVLTDDFTLRDAVTGETVKPNLRHYGEGGLFDYDSRGYKLPYRAAEAHHD